MMVFDDFPIESDDVAHTLKRSQPILDADLRFDAQVSAHMLDHLAFRFQFEPDVLSVGKLPDFGPILEEMLVLVPQLGTKVDFFDLGFSRQGKPEPEFIPAGRGCVAKFEGGAEVFAEFVAEVGGEIAPPEGLKSMIQPGLVAHSQVKPLSEILLDLHTRTPLKVAGLGIRSKRQQNE